MKTWFRLKSSLKKRKLDSCPLQSKSSKRRPSSSEDYSVVGNSADVNDVPLFTLQFNDQGDDKVFVMHPGQDEIYQDKY